MLTFMYEVIDKELQGTMKKKKYLVFTVSLCVFLGKITQECFRGKRGNGECV